jgi:[Skp1-protein]-hydroxyproline N-acetylglucosaminyltransferase
MRQSRVSRPAPSSSSSFKISNTLDRPIIIALSTLVVIFTIITIVTYYKVSDTNHDETTVVVSAINTFQKNQFNTFHNIPSDTTGSNPKKEKSHVQIDQIQHMFPIHVEKDVETIVHPGLELANPQKIPQNIAHTMTVPKFFDSSHGYYYYEDSYGKLPIDSQSHPTKYTIRNYLGNGETLITPELASTIGSYTTINGIEYETIYCSVASYRDPECTGSVEDLYDRAEHPERIRVAILDQRLDGDNHCIQPSIPCNINPNQALCKYRHLIDVYEMDAQLAVGPVFARHLAHRHYRGEYYAMQIDSHVRFIEHWDSDIIGQWKSAYNEMAVLSTYLSDIINSIDPITHKGKHEGRPIMCESDYEGYGETKHLRHGQQPEGIPGIVGQPTLHPFWAAGFSFARGHFVIQVPYDQYLPMVFQGEEISIGLRGFTYGYDYYAAERSVCFHMYAIKENEERRKKIPLFWENSNIYEGVGKKAMKRLNSIIGMANFSTSEWKQDEIHKYGLGKVRTTEKFFNVFGIHVQNQTVEHHLCSFVGKPMMKVFLPALRENHMGLDYDQINYEFKDPNPRKPKPTPKRKL